MQTVVTVLPFLWPRDQPAVRARVVVALACLVVGSGANAYGPIVLRDLIDGLQALLRSTPLAPLGAAPGLTGLLLLVLLYGAMVLLPGVLTEARAAVFTPVPHSATFSKSQRVQRDAGTGCHSFGIGLMCP